MWVSRDKDGELNLFIEKPRRRDVNWDGQIIGTLSNRYYNLEVMRCVDKIDGFENLTWEDEPVEVLLTVIK